MRGRGSGVGKGGKGREVPPLLSLHFKHWCIFNLLYVMRPEATEFREITQTWGLLRRSRSSQVTEFGTNRKLICDFILVINSNLHHILHRFRDTAFERSKILLKTEKSCSFLALNKITRRSSAAVPICLDTV